MNFGVYRYQEPLVQAEIQSLEDRYKTNIRILSVYRAWNTCSVDNDITWLNRLRGSNRQILLTWEPWIIPPKEDKPYDQPDFSLMNILSGRFDDYIKSFTQILETFPRPVFLRVMHEMNGNWYPWCGTVNSNSPELFVDTWNYIRNIADSKSLSNVTWVWSPYARSYPDVSDNSIEQYFPGDHVMDIAAIDGYNWGTSRPWSAWQNFEEIFSNAYKTVTALSTRPVIIGEVASCEEGGDKGQWITDAIHSLSDTFPRVKALVWFDKEKECDWRIDSSPLSLKAFRESASIFT